MTGDLAWRVEAACLAAFPAAQDESLGGWRLRWSGGSTRRTNSANPGRDHAPLSTILSAATAFYAQHRQPLIVRVPGIAPALDAELDAAGCGAAEAPTATLYADRLGECIDPASGMVIGTDRPGPAWLAARAEITAASPADQAIFAAMAQRIAGPVRFVSIVDATGTVAVAYGAIRDGLLVIEAVATAPAARRRGHGRALVSALSAWGETMGASAACLQVVIDNEPAQALYRDLGFTRMLYAYHYRRLSMANEVPPGSLSAPKDRQSL